MDDKPLIDLEKYAQISYEFSCFNNNIPPDWDVLEPRQKEYWINLARNVIMEYRSDAIQNQLIGGVVEEVGALPDGSGFALIMVPLPKNHWMYGDLTTERQGDWGSFEPPPMPMRIGKDDPRRKELTEMLIKAGRYAVRSATMQGQVIDFDPDALIQNLVVGMLGYHTPDGLSSDEWANPVIKPKNES